MADVPQEQDVNQAPESSTEAEQVSQANPPAEENSAPPAPTKVVPYPRFSEVVHERNREREMREQYEARIRELEAQRSGSTNKSALDRLAAKLQSELSMEEGPARKLAAIQLEAAEQVAKSQTEQLRQQTHSYEIDSWTRNLAMSYPDFESVKPAMEKVFQSLRPEAQDLAVSSQDGLEMLYHKAKATVAGDKSKAAFDKGVQQAYGNKGLKAAVSSAPSMGATGGKLPLTKENLAKMSDKEFIERKAEIDAWVVEQSRRR